MKEFLKKILDIIMSPFQIFIDLIKKILFFNQIKNSINSIKENIPDSVKNITGSISKLNPIDAIKKSKDLLNKNDNKENKNNEISDSPDNHLNIFNKFSDNLSFNENKENTEKDSGEKIKINKSYAIYFFKEGCPHCLNFSKDFDEFIDTDDGKIFAEKIIFKKINIYSEIQDEDFEIIELQNLIKKLTGVPSVLFFNSNKELLDIKVVGNDISRFKEILNKNFLNN